MQLILVPVDGSRPSERAVKHVIRLRDSAMSLRLLLVNVQPEWAPTRCREEASEGERLNARRGAIARVVLGSVSVKTLQPADAPVTLVK